MKGSINKVIIIGRLGADPDLRYMPSGDPVANFNVATDESFKDKDGNLQEKTEWHKVVAFKRLAEICGEYLKKGKLVYVEGRIQTRSWEDKNGVKRFTTEIVANVMQMLEKKGEVSNDMGTPPPQEGGGSNKLEGDEDDLPF